MARELTGEDWDLLWRHFLGAKQEAAEHADLETLEAVFPDEAFAGDGAMVLYTEVFPFDAGFTLGCTDEDDWRVDDHHCLAPHCTCRSAVLSFLRIRHHANSLRASATEMAAAMYDYQSRAFTPTGHAAPDAPPLNTLVSVLREHHPDLDRRLADRHDRLRVLFARALERRKRSVRAAAAPPPSSHSKTGRNDPCPCGSGKKFKRCCGLA